MSRIGIVTLQERVDELFQSALHQTANRPALTDLRRELEQCRARLHQPMRVAIVGLIKAGKSTMMNALLGEAVVATGTVETTFNVNWLRYGEKPALTVHFKDGRPAESKSFDELAALTRRADENRDYLLGIKYVQVDYPNPILQTFNLIDTPGLESYYEEDAKNTRDFILSHGQELTEVTQREASHADAVLYLFSYSVSTADKSVVEEFLGPALGRATPINAIGVLTKVDGYWSDYDNPMEAADTICRRLTDNAQVRNLFYAVYPVCGLLALGAQTLQPDEFEILTRLSALPAERLNRLVRNVMAFGKREYPDDPAIPPVAERRQVMHRLGQYGVWLACRLIREGIPDREPLISELLQRSGVPKLRDLIVSHFGNRAFLIKLGTVLRQVEETCFREQRRQSGEEQLVVKQIAGECQALEAQEHAFKELRVLRSYYEGKLNFSSDEVKQLLQVTGEYGTSCGERLGLGERALASEMLPVAEERMRYWYLRANDFISADSVTIAAAEVVARSYERILYHVNEARKHLYI
jgi:GTPase SAR1 family protein